VKQNHVWWAAERADASRFRALVAATLLRASGDSTHPMCVAAPNAPDLLIRLEQVTSHAGEATHDAEDLRLNVQIVEGCINETINIVGLLLGLPVRSLSKVASNE
jgi:hypothetical protein